MEVAIPISVGSLGGHLTWIPPTKEITLQPAFGHADFRSEAAERDASLLSKVPGYVRDPPNQYAEVARVPTAVHVLLTFGTNCVPRNTPLERYQSVPAIKRTCSLFPSAHRSNRCPVKAT